MLIHYCCEVLAASLGNWNFLFIQKTQTMQKAISQAYTHNPASILQPWFEESSPALKGWSLQWFHAWLLLLLKLANFTHSLEGHYACLEKSLDFISSFTSFSRPDHLFLTSLSDLAKCGKADYCWHTFYQPLHDQQNLLFPPYIVKAKQWLRLFSCQFNPHCSHHFQGTA